MRYTHRAQVHIILIVDPADGVSAELQTAVTDVAKEMRGRALHILMMRDDENEEMQGVLQFLKVIRWNGMECSVV
jgi:hypothetical protein